MKEIAQKYLGNITEDFALEQRLTIARNNNRYLEVFLQKNDLVKGRILVDSSSGVEIGIIKSRDLVVRAGDVFETESENLVLIKLKSEKLMVLSFEDSLNNNYDMKLVSLGHILGNHHYPIQIEQNKIYVRLITEAKVLIKMIEELDILGLKITFETSSDREIPQSKHSH
ncbi:urease accessory protein UreE [Xenococcus sp. PCC 7305]|uniref:urease accessory protein UreE n=1 Tax=Xenococcus sp. PCC 7305 TaxID=102125 RepID=UPI0002ACF2AF|nr:urease accessory protein UreE [Xenococcus sp. PCC 7305]ELS02271.1 urease accessory protein UreE [Xenococcus sp. PCC 7305]